MTVTSTIMLASLIITFAIFLAGVIFKTGHLTARVESLEEWRQNVRGDFHEVSQELNVVTVELRALRTIIEERTDRRSIAKLI